MRDFTCVNPDIAQKCCQERTGVRRDVSVSDEEVEHNDGAVELEVVVLRYEFHHLQ